MPVAWPVERGERRRRSLRFTGSPTPSSELIRRGDMSTVGEWAAQRKSRLGTWLSADGIFIAMVCLSGRSKRSRGIQSIITTRSQGWSCSNSVFVRTCPTLATPEDEARVAEEFRKQARLERK